MRWLFPALAIAAALAMAPASSAQERDPFQPLIEPETDTGVVPDGEAELPVVVPAPDPDEPLPQTGDDPRTPLAVAFVLVALGGMALVLARINAGPVRPPHRSR